MAVSLLTVVLQTTATSLAGKASESASLCSEQQILDIGTKPHVSFTTSPTSLNTLRLGALSLGIFPVTHHLDSGGMRVGRYSVLSDYRLWRWYQIVDRRQPTLCSC